MTASSSIITTCPYRCLELYITQHPYVYVSSGACGGLKVSLNTHRQERDPAHMPVSLYGTCMKTCYCVCPGRGEAAKRVCPYVCVCVCLFAGVKGGRVKGRKERRMERVTNRTVEGRNRGKARSDGRGKEGWRAGRAREGRVRYGRRGKGREDGR